MANLGQSIRTLRTDQDVSLRALAGKVGISAPYLCDIELGRRLPARKVLAEIAHQLRIPLDRLEVLDPKPYVRELKAMIEQNPQLGPGLVKYARKLKTVR